MNDDLIMKSSSGCYIRRMLCLLALLFSCLLLLPSSCQGSPRLLFSNRQDIYLVDSANPGKRSPLLEKLSEAAAVDFLYEENSKGEDRSTYCWSEHFEGIYCTTAPDVHTRRAIASTGVLRPDGLAIDWVTKKLYWVDSLTKSIEVCVLKDGSHRKVLYYDNVDQPRALALDPQSGYLYWTDWGEEEPKIERGGMNGDLATRSTIISKTIGWPNGLTIDYVQRQLYWVDAQLSYIHTAKLDGTERTIVKNGSLAHPFAITVYEDRLYWTDWKNRSIFSCKKTDCSSVSTVMTNLLAPMDIDVFEPDRQARVANPCARKNGGCSHLCLLAPAGSINCACPTGTLLSDDGHTCSPVREMIFLARRFDLRMISLDTPDFTDSVIPLKDVAHAIAIDFDPVERYVYWTDDEKQQIQRAKLDGTGQETIINVEVIHPDGIAIDWVSRNLFWTDTGTDRIEVARLDGSSRRVLISDMLDEPRAITVDPMNGTLYWTDWGAHPKIETAAMDGSMRQVLINTSLQWPNGIAVDFEYMRLYWADAKLDKIERSNMDGSDRTVIVDSHIPHVFGFDLAGKYIYWTDWQRRTIERVDKLIPGGTRELIVDQLPDLMAIRAMAMKPNSSHTNGCASAGANGGCSHLCLNTPTGHVCACPMGMELFSDKKKCIVPEAFLLFSQKKTIKRASIQYTHKDTSLPIQYLSNVTALDIHVQRKLLFFADTVNGSIRHAFLNGSAVSMVLEFTKESPTAMAVDWLSENLYFVDDSRKLIEVYNLKGRYRKVVIWQKLGEPRNIALHPAKGYIYWTDWNHENRSVIGRANLDGTNQISMLSGIGRCGSINIDMDANRVYWINYDHYSIQSADLNGEDLQTIKGQLASPVAVNVYDSYVYWYDLKERAIRRVHKENRSDEAIVQTDINSMINLLIFHQSRQRGRSNCTTKNGDCQYFCFSTGQGGKSKCGCPTHYLLNKDGKTCSAPKNFLLLSEGAEPSSRDMQIKRLLDSSTPELVLPMRFMRSVKTLEYDSLNNKIYWIVDAGKFKAIRRSSIDGSDPELFLHNNQFVPSSMAIDPYSRNMFWVDANNHLINVTTLNRVSIGVIYRNETNPPQAIALSPRQGYIFFITKINQYTRTNMVLRTYFDGSKLKTIVTGGTISAIAVDQQRDWLYYSDRSTRTIRSCDSDGQNVRTLVENVLVNTLTVYNDKLYYAQGSTQLYFCEKTACKTSLLVLRGQTNITDVHAVNGDGFSNRRRNPCANNNGDCSHICFTDSDGLKQCGCPAGFELHLSRFTCNLSPTCSPGSFKCKTGQAPCIPYSWVCDGSPECADGSDEQNCPQSCAENEFTCDNGLCIDKSKLCDRIADCTDNSDEDTKRCCTADKFRCKSSMMCIPRNKYGDGVNDCDDNSDEPQQAPSTQPSNPYAVGIIVVLCIVSVFILFIIIFVIWKCHKRSNSLRYTDPGMGAQQVTSLDSLGTTMLDGGTLNHVPQSVTATTVISGSSGGIYDRNHVTGASSSSSSMTHLQAGFNPPPSPVTERSAFIGHGRMIDVDDSSTLVSSAYPGYHAHSKRHNVKVPPTTPISTCDDSEPSMVNYSTQRPRVKRRSNKKYHLLKQYTAAEPLPPPPTPSRSQICSADEASECPPSPSTVRSFRSTTNNPYPPPPSPEPTSDNS